MADPDAVSDPETVTDTDPDTDTHPVASAGETRRQRAWRTRLPKGASASIPSFRCW